MIKIEELVGRPVEDPEFIRFWGDKDFEVTQISDDEEHTIDQPRKGFSVVISQGLIVDTVTVASKNAGANFSKYSNYKGILPEGLSFGMKSAKVLALLGEPSEQNEKYSSFMGVEIHPWKKYIRSTYEINITFDKKGRKVTLVSVVRK